MKAVFTIILSLCMLQNTLAQSPFNYGQNKHVYFISTELRNTLGIDSIYTMNQHAPEDFGGMGENWDVTLIAFDEYEVTDDWYPISRDSTFRFNFDSLITGMEFLNGSRYEFADGKLIAYGGGGYGTFDWKDVVWASDTISIIETSCVGHCGNNANISYSKNVFNKKGQLIYTVYYPSRDDVDDALNEEEAADEGLAIYEDQAVYEENTPDGEEGESEYGMSLQQYEALLNSTITAENVPDTIRYRYDNNGLLLNTKGTSIQNVHEAKLLFINSNGYIRPKFHQCYVGRIKMEKFMSKKLGYKPELILIELYQHAVFSFALNPADKKYHQTDFIILEQ